MPPSEQCRVFISYAHRDGADLAQRLQQSLKEQGFDAWLDTQRLTGGIVWSAEIEREIDARQITLALLSPGSYSSEICRAEQLRSLDKGNRVIPVLAVKDADRPLYLYARQYRDFSRDANYAASLGELLGDIRGDATATLPDNYRKTRVTYLTAPPRVANYLERPEALHALRDALFAEDHRQPIALTALAGMGGIGKTVLAKALTEDEVVQRAFPDGIVWITAGKERKRDFIEEMREVAKALGDELSGYDTALACENQYRTTIASKAALIVVDDVWSKADIEPLLAESPRSRFLFTTRDAAIGRFVSAHEHRADLLDVAQSRELLASWASLPVAELPAAADEVIAECGRLPLALSVVGAMLRGADPEFWTDTLDLLRKADLSAIEDQLPEGQQSFFKAVEVSFQSLKPEMQERYKTLAVLLEDMAAPLPVLQTLWNANEAEARRWMRQFVDRSLAQRESHDQSIRLHDLQLDYVRTRYPDKKALKLIHGAMRLSSHVTGKDTDQFASQMVGRLLPHYDQAAIRHFVETISAGAPRPWLRPLAPGLTPPGTGLVRTLAGHTDAVSAVTLSADGKVAASTGGRGTKLWDVLNGQERRTFADPVAPLAMSADGRVAISESRDGVLKVWDVESGRERRTLQGHKAWIRSLALSGDGTVAVSASEDRTVKVWNVESGRELSTLASPTNGVWRLALSGDGKIAVFASDDQTLKVWDVESGRERRTLRGHKARIRSLALSGDGTVAVSASEDRTVKVWNVESGRERWTFAGSECVAVSRDGEVAVSASGDELLVFDLRSGQEWRGFRDHTGRINGVAVSGDGKVALSASEDWTIKVWDIESRLELRLPLGHRRPVRGVAMSADGKVGLSASSDYTLKVWDVVSGVERCTLKGHSRDVYGVAVRADGKLAVSASLDHTLRVWDLDGGTPDAQARARLRWGRDGRRRKHSGRLGPEHIGRMGRGDRAVV